MKKPLLILQLATFSFVFSCKNGQKSDTTSLKDSENIINSEISNDSTISFEIAKNYFVKNTFKVLRKSKIEKTVEFDEIFGMAPVMGIDGKPTPIDFSKKYVIAIVLPETDFETSITPETLQKNEKGEIVFSYKILKGKKQTFSIRPNLAIIVDKSADGQIILNEQP